MAVSPGSRIRLQATPCKLVTVNPVHCLVHIVYRLFPAGLSLVAEGRISGWVDAGSPSSWWPVVVFNDYRIAMNSSTPYLKLIGSMGSSFDLVAGIFKNDEKGNVSSWYSGFKLSYSSVKRHAGPQVSTLGGMTRMRMLPGNPFGSFGRASSEPGE